VAALGVIGHLREIMWWVVLPQYPPSARWLSPFIARPTDFGHTLIICSIPSITCPLIKGTVTPQERHREGARVVSISQPRAPLRPL